jgi:hypothetical protein
MPRQGEVLPRSRRDRRTRPAPGRRISRLTTSGDTKTLIEGAIARFLAEVPALTQLKLVVGLELRAHHDTQFYRVELPGPNVTKSIAEDSKITLEVQRAAFNDLAAKGDVSDWRSAFEHGDAKAHGVDQYIRLIRQVVEKQEERTRLRAATRRH